MFARRADGFFLSSSKVIAFFLTAITTGCFLDTQSSANPTASSATSAAVKARFDLGPSPMPFGAIPWPDDLYLGENGHINLGHLSTEYTDSPFARSLLYSLQDRDGFGAMSPIYFYFDGPLNRSTLDQSSVFLIDLETGSPESLKDIEPDIEWNQERGEVSLRPRRNHPLRAGHKYAAVVTRSVKAADGSPVGPADSFAALRDQAPPATSETSVAAYNEYAPVISLLEHQQGIKRERIAALAVFTVSAVGADLAEAREIIRR
jgi:hypothetical protein